MDEGSRAQRRYALLRSALLLHGQRLHTICEEARCPNIAECWGRGTATFQILGGHVHAGVPLLLRQLGQARTAADPLEPLRLAHAAAQMELHHVVVTSVDRDDLPDKGAGHYAATIRTEEQAAERAVEVLTPDFLGYEEEALEIVLAARPEVFNHNIETVRRPHRRTARCEGVLRQGAVAAAQAKEMADYPVLTKSGIIVGLGETNDEVVETMRDLRAAGVTSSRSASTSSRHRSTRRSTAGCTRTSFWFREQGEALGFGSVFSGPLVRSSYRADEQKHAADTGRGAVAYAREGAAPRRRPR